MRKISVLLFWLALGSALGGAQGGSVYLSPTVVVMTYGNATSSIAVRNDSSRPMGFSIRAYRWTNAADGNPQLDPTDEIIVFPTAIALQAGETKRIRLGTQIAAGADANAAERSYRVILDEIVSAASIQRNGLNTRMQFSLPVFVQPRNRIVNVSMPAPTLEGNALHLTVSNPGRLHVTPERIEARGLSAAGAVVWTRNFRPWYLLSGEVRNQQAALSAAECRATAVIVAEATFLESNRLSLREERKVAGAGCSGR